MGGCNLSFANNFSFLAIFTKGCLWCCRAGGLCCARAAGLCCAATRQQDFSAVPQSSRIFCAAARSYSLFHFFPAATGPQGYQCVYADELPQWGIQRPPPINNRQPKTVKNLSRDSNHQRCTTKYQRPSAAHHKKTALGHNSNRLERTPNQQHSSTAHQESTVTTQSAPQNTSSHPERTKKYEQPSKTHQQIMATIQCPLGLTVFVQTNSNVHHGLWTLGCTKVQFLRTVDSSHAEAIGNKR